MLRIILIMLLTFLCENSYPQIDKNTKRVFVFGDSHTKGGLGESIGDSIRKLNPNIEYQYYGENGAGFINNFNNHKTKLLDKIKDFNPNIVICIMGTNDIFQNEKNYDKLLTSANKFFNDDFNKYNIIIVSTMFYNYENCRMVSKGLETFSLIRGFMFINIFNEKYSVLRYSTDKYHFSISGYRLISKYIIEECQK